MMNKSRGHFCAILTICIWATTFVSTKILLTDFKPIEILFIRFLIGFVTLIIIYPKRLPHTTKSQEYYFIAAGCTGICLYYLLENIALTYTSASNVGVLISVAPFFTGLLSIGFGFVPRYFFILLKLNSFFMIILLSRHLLFTKRYTCCKL